MAGEREAVGRKGVHMRRRTLLGGGGGGDTRWALSSSSARHPSRESTRILPLALCGGV